MCATCGSANRTRSTMRSARASRHEIELALAGRLDDWSATRDGTLALILLLDQFTRNVFRETPRAFAGDAAALITRARAGLFRARPRFAADRALVHLHAVRACGEPGRPVRVGAPVPRASHDAGLAEPLTWAVKHFEVIRRFGRFPASQRRTGPRLDARRSRVPRAAGFALLVRPRRVRDALARIAVFAARRAIVHDFAPHACRRYRDRHVFGRAPAGRARSMRAANSSASGTRNARCR